jgi:hypothetical protein
MLRNHHFPAAADHGEVPAQVVSQLPDADRIYGYIHESIIATSKAGESRQCIADAAEASRQSFP